ncbi:Ig-like domain-containing protein [Streptomyces kaempferi]
MNAAATTTVLTSAPDPSVFGQGKVLTATVTVVAPGTGVPSGTVSFFDGATLLGTGTLAGGVATFTTATLNAGSHPLTAVYGGVAPTTAPRRRWMCRRSTRPTPRRACPLRRIRRCSGSRWS